MKSNSLTIKSWARGIRAHFPRWLTMGILALSMVLPSRALPLKLGDLNSDGQVTVLDLVMLINHINGIAALPPDLAVFADVNQDGVINDRDAALMAQAILGLSPLPTLPLATVRQTSPANGDGEVSVNRQTIFYLTMPLSPGALITTTQLFAQFAGRKLLSRIELSTDRRSVSLFYLEPLPGASRIRVVFDGTGIKDFLERDIDLDGDGTAGGQLTVDFDTLNNNPLTGTVVAGRVFASELAAVNGSTNSVNQPLGGVTITVDGQEESLRAVTDQFGNFRLDPAPAGQFFVHIDGRTATNAVAGGGYPNGAYYPYVGKEWTGSPGAEVNIGNIYLPLVAAGTLQTLNPTQPTVVTFPTAVVQAHPELAGVTITVPSNSLFGDDGSRGGKVGIAPVPPDRLPSPLPAGLQFSLVITVQSDGAQNFDQPVPACFPNLPDTVTGKALPPGAKSALWSFNHRTGRWEIQGPMTVSADGKFVCTDPGVGIPMPGWHGVQQGSVATGGSIDSGGGPETSQEKGSQHVPPACPSPIVPCPKKDDPVADPLYLFSGEFYESVEDLRIKGRGLDFIWTRKYRSKNAQPCVQGYGWDCSYNVYLTQQGADLVLFDGNSRSDVYKHQADGTWSQREFFRQLVQNADKTFTMTFEDQGQWNFYAFDGSARAGKLRSSVDRNGNPLGFDYDAQGRLDRVTDTLGRDIQVAYNPQGYISSVTDFAGRAVRYAYYDGTEPGGNAGDLKSVTTPAVTGTPNGNDFPNGKTTTYTYSTGFADERLNHNLLTITDGRRNDTNDVTSGQGPYLINVYSSAADSADPNFDRVVRQIWGGDTIDLVYVPMLPGNANGLVVMKTILRDRNGDVKEYFFDSRNRVVRRREFAGRAKIGQPTTENSNRPTNKLRSTDPDYYETIYQWNDDSLQTLTISPNGNLVQNVYQSDIDPAASPRVRGNLRVARRLPGTHSPAGDQPVLEEKFDYDSDYAGGCCGFNFVTRYTDAKGNVTIQTYDIAGNRIQTQHALPNIVDNWEYNQFGQATAHVLPDNGSGYRRRDERTYYASGPQRGYVNSTLEDAAGTKLATTFEYDAVGNIVRIIDPRGHDSKRIYNSLDQVVREISRETADGSGIRYQRDFFYDANNNVARIEVLNLDGLGVAQSPPRFATTFEYEILNHPTRVSQQIDSAHSTASIYAYDGNRNRVLEQFGEAVNGNQPANTVKRTFDERDLPFQMTRADGDPAHATTQMDYDLNGNIARTREGLESAARETIFVYDGYNRLVRTTDAMGNTLSHSYDANGNPSTLRAEGELHDAPGGAGNIRLGEIAYLFDAMDREVRVESQFFDATTQQGIGKGKSVTQIAYTPLSKLAQVINDNGHGNQLSYDGDNRLASVADSKGNLTSYSYDANNNILRRTQVEKSTLGNPDQTFVTDYIYDNLDRIVRTTDNAGNINEYGYDSRNNRTVTLDAARAPGKPGNQTSQIYDGLDRLVQTTRFLSSDGTGSGTAAGTIVTRQIWDDSSRLTAQIDGNAHATMYNYDPLGRKTAITFADGTARKFSYNANDDLLRETDANGTVIQYSYDLLGRVIRKDIQPGAGVANDTTFETMQYDGLSRLAQAANDAANVTLAYDSLGNISSETLNGQLTTSSYDGAGNLLGIVYPGGRKVSMVYDELERKQAIMDVSGAAPQTIASYDYAGFARVERVRFANQTQEAIAYDAAKRVVRTTHSRIGGSVFDDRDYGWEGRFNRTSHSDRLPGGEQHQYNYDSVNRLVHSALAIPGGGSLTSDFQFDSAGNRTAVSGGIDAGNYTLAEAKGGPIDAPVNQYTRTPFDQRTYDPNGNLQSQSATTVKSFGYDYMNRLVSAKDNATGAVTRYAYDGLGRRIEKRTDGNTGATTRYFYHGWQVCEEQDANGATVATYVHGRYLDEVLTMRRGGKDYYYHGDDLFTTRKLTDSAGNVVESYVYGDFGEPAFFNGAGVSIAQSQVDNPYLFTGHRYDRETGFFHLRARYLDPRAGRFITRDPIGPWGDSLNLGNGLSFVGNNPNSFVDPFGYWGLASWILTGDGNASQDVYDAAKQQFQETLWDRTDATIKTITAGKANANNLCDAFQPSTWGVDTQEQDIVFDPVEQAKQACFTKCWALKTADAILMGAIGDEKAGVLLNVASLIPANPASAAAGTESLFDPSAKDVPGTIAGPVGRGFSMAAKGAAAQAKSLQGLSSAKQFLAGIKEGQGWAMQQKALRNAAKWEKAAKNLDKAGKVFAGAALAIDLWNCYQDCEKNPCSHMGVPNAEALGKWISKHVD